MAGTLNPFDLFVLIVLVLSTFWGGMRGIVAQLTSIFSWLASAYISTHYYHVLAKFMNASYSYRTPLAMIVTFIVSALLIRFASGFVRNIVSLAGLKEFDRQMGALLGMAKGVLLCLLVTFLLVVANDSTRAVIEESRTGPFFASFLSKIQERLPDSELTKKFVAHTNTIEDEKQQDLEEDGTVMKSISTEVRDLKKYLLTKVLSEQATDILAEAEETVEEEPTKTPFGAFLQSATSSMGRIKDSLSDLSPSEENYSSGTTDSLSSIPTNARNAGVQPSYEQRVYDDDEGNVVLSAIGSEVRSAGGTVANYQYDNAYEFEASQGNPNSRGAGSGDSLGGLASFLSSIGGGFGGYADVSDASSSSLKTVPSGAFFSPSLSDREKNSDYYGDEWNDGYYYQPSIRTGSARTNTSSSSRSRLNSRTYTLTPSTINY